MSNKYYAVIVNVPGYLPDSEPTYFGGPDALERAVDQAHEEIANYSEFDFTTTGDGCWYGETEDGAELAIEIQLISKEQYDRETSY